MFGGVHHYHASGLRALNPPTPSRAGSWALSARSHGGFIKIEARFNKQRPKAKTAFVTPSRASFSAPRWLMSWLDLRINETRILELLYR